MIIYNNHLYVYTLSGLSESAPYNEKYSDAKLSMESLGRFIPTTSVYPKLSYSAFPRAL